MKLKTSPKLATAAATTLLLIPIVAPANADAPTSATNSATRVAFDLPAQPLSTSLHTIADKLNTNILFDPEQVKDLKAPAIKGTVTIEQALATLLAGTKLKYEYMDERTISLSLMPAATKITVNTGALRLAQNTGNTGNTGEENAGTEGARNEEPSVSVGNDSKEKDSSESAKNRDSDSKVPIQEVIVTAQKQQERLQDVPVPVTALSAETLIQYNLVRVQEYYHTVPGLNLTLTGNGGEPVINIRGITTGGSNPTVAVVVDDVQYGPTVNPAAPPSIPDIDPGDLARVEVLRGPQGTLYGASSIGGLLKFVTVDPSTEALTGRIQTGTSSVHRGDDVGYNVRGAINVPLGDDLAVRASGFTAREPGYVDNVRTGQQDVDRRDSQGGRVSALWRPSDAFSLKLSALVQDVERDGTQDVDAALGAGRMQQQAMRNTGQYERRTDVYSAIATVKLGNAELTWAGGFNSDEIFTRVDASPVPLLSGLAAAFGGSGAAIPFEVEVQKLTQELRASIPLGDRVEWMVGLFYTDEDFESTNTIEANDLSTGNVVAPLLTTDLPADFRERAMFTNLTFDVTDRLDIQFGGRLSENKQRFDGLRRGTLASLFFGSDPSITPTVRSEDSPFTYLVTPRYKITPDLMAYSRLASGYRPGGPNPGCGLTIADVPCDYGPDKTQTYEVGLKGSVAEGAFTFDASVYYIDWADIQIPLEGVAVAFTENASEARSQGIELAVESSPLEGVTLSGWIAWNDAELTEDFPASSATVGGRGDRLPFSSRLSGNLSLAWEVPLSGNTVGLLGGSVSYVGDRKGSFRSGAEVRETYDAYSQVDLSAGLRYETWSLRAFMTNVGDERGVLRSGVDSISPTFISYIQPRTAGLSLTKTF